MADLQFWRDKVGELSSRRLTLKERLKGAKGKKRQRLLDQIQITDMDLERAQELLNEERKGIDQL